MTPVDVWPVIPRGPGHHGLAGPGGPIGVGLAGTRRQRADSAPAIGLTGPAGGLTGPAGGLTGPAGGLTGPARPPRGRPGIRSVNEA